MSGEQRVTEERVAPMTAEALADIERLNDERELSPGDVEWLIASHRATEAKLKTVLDREAATIKRYDDRLDEAEAKLRDALAEAERLAEVLLRVRDRCLIAEDDMQVSVTTDPHIDEALFADICNTLAKRYNLLNVTAESALAATKAKLEAAEKAIALALPQAEGCHANHYGDNPEGSAEPEHIRLMRAALTTQEKTDGR